MKGRFAALFVVVSVFCLLVSGAQASKVLFEDKFATLDPGWGEPGNIINVKDNKLVLAPDINTSQTVLYQANLFTGDLEVSATVSVVKADDLTFGGGLVFWGKDYSEYYAVLITADGYFVVQRHIGGRFLAPVTWRENASIKKGVGAENQLRILTKGNQGKLYINGTEVVTFSGTPPQGGSIIGVRGGSPSQGQNVYSFSDLKVLQP
jgi:hypothetical protein